MMDQIDKYNQAVKGLDAQDIIKWTFNTFETNKIFIASSFSAEDQVVTDMTVNIDRNSRIFTLDTGRHFQETYQVWQKSIAFWDINYEIGFPEPNDIFELIYKNGPDHLYESVNARKACCAVRKTKPLRKLLSTVDAWIVGLRSEQSITRSGLEPVEWDEANGVFRISPLYNWSESTTIAYVNEHHLPMSVLYDKGFRSIGCAPCTRAIGKDDEVRAGRWWWEEPLHKECGLHNRQKNKADK